MNYIILIGDGFFGGWDANIGIMKLVYDKQLAYRMRYPIASKTLPKVLNQYGKGEIAKL